MSLDALESSGWLKSMKQFRDVESEIYGSVRYVGSPLQFVQCAKQQGVLELTSSSIEILVHGLK